MGRIRFNEKQTVLIVHNYYKISGGEDIVVANEKKLLENHGHKVYLYVKHNNELDRMSKLRIAVESIFNYKTYKEIRSLIKEKDIDIVHVHNTLHRISPSVYYAARSRRVPVVQTIHNFRMLCPNALFYRDGHICEECLEHGLRRSIKYACYRDSVFQTMAVVFNMKIHRATGIYKNINYICLTEFNRNKLLNFKQIKPERVFVKPNFASGNILSEEVLNQFVFAGRIDNLKGIRILFKAWKKYEDVGGNDSLIVCGSGTEENWCRSYIRAHKLKYVELKGHLSNTETKKIIAKSKALILPTQWYEGFPMIIAESFAVGTPVICSNIGNAADIVEEGVTGYKFNGGEDGLFNTILKMLSNNIDREHIRDIYRYRYSEEINYKSLKRIYDSIALYSQ